MARALPALVVFLVAIAPQPGAAIQSLQSKISLQADDARATAAAADMHGIVSVAAGVSAAARLAAVDRDGSASRVPPDLYEQLLEVPTEQGKMEFLGCNWGPASRWHLAKLAMTRWYDAVEEAGIDPTNVSLFGCTVPKFPMSWVQRIQALNHTKIHDYNFRGSYMLEFYRATMPQSEWHSRSAGIPGAWTVGVGDAQAAARDWIMAFAKDNFTERDHFVVTDADASYKKIGPFDASEPSTDLQLRRGVNVNYHEFDTNYWEVMTKSKFTLCPGGDDPWSMRLYEAVLSGSIPIIANSSLDVGMPHFWSLWDIPYHYYNLETGDELIYREDWVEDNLKLFIKYQTFHEGDLAAPHTFNVTRRILELTGTA